MADKIKILLLGIGRWGTNHFRILKNLPVELFVVDPDAGKVEKARSSGFDAQHISTNYNDFKDRVDAAIIVTPAQTHYELCRLFLESGKDVFVEKPITLVSCQAKELAQLAESNGRILQVGHIFRFDPAAQWLRDNIRGGLFGKLKILRGSFSGFKRPRSDSGVAFADAIHFIDLFNFISGEVPIRVTARLYDFLGRGMDDEALIVLDYKAGFTGIIQAGYHNPGKFRFVEVLGESMSAVCDFNAAQYKVKTYANTFVGKDGVFQAQEGSTQQIEFTPEEPLQAELRAFIESIRTRNQPLADGWSGYEAVRILECTVESSNTFKSIQLI